MKPLEGQILEPIRVLGSSHPLRNTMETVTLQAGLTIEEIFDTVIADRATHKVVKEGLTVYIDGQPVYRDYWRLVRPKPGTVVIFRATVQEGKLLRSVLTLAVAISALFVAPLIGPAIGSALGLSAGLGTAIAGAAITLAGTLLINALFPLRPPQLQKQTGKLFNLSGSQNQSTPWDIVPQNLGDNRVYPRFAAKPYTEIVGNEQYLRLLYTAGYGPNDVTAIKIGDTPIARFDATTWIYEGYDSDNEIRAFPSTVDEVTLDNFELRSVDSWTTPRNTSLDTEEISWDFVAPNGIYELDQETGAFGPYTVTINCQYRRVGVVPWTDAPNVVFPRSRNPLRRTSKVEGLASGQYEVRTRKVTTDATETNVQDHVFWVAYRSFTNDPPINFPKRLTVVAVRIKANSGANGILNALNFRCQSRVTAFNGSTWVGGQPSRNPADLFLWVAKGPANSDPYTDDEIDYDSLEAWWAYCNSQTPVLAFDMWITDESSVRARLDDIAAAGRARVADIEGKLGVIFNESTDEPVWHFTPRNSWGFSTEGVYRELPHALRVRFINRSRNFHEDERQVYDDGYTSANATRFELVEFPGVTSPGNIWRDGRFQLAQARLRPFNYTLSSDIEGLRVTQGDRVRVSHDVALWGSGHGRVKEVVVTTDTQEIVLDETVTLEVGEIYDIRFRLSTGGTLLRRLINTANETNTVTLDGIGALPEVGDLFSFGPPDLETVTLRVLSVRSIKDLGFEFTMVDDAPDIFEADTGEIPAWDPQITEPPDPFDLGPVTLQAGERIVGIGATAKTQVMLDTQVPRLGYIKSFEYQAKDIDAEGDWERLDVVLAPQLQAFSDDLEPGLWQFRVRSIFEDGRHSDWVESNVLTVTGLLDPPPDVTGFSGFALESILRFTWNAVATINVSHARMKYSDETDGSATWGTSIDVIPQIVGTAASVPVRPGTYLIKWVTFQGVESDEPAIFITNSEAPSQNIVQTITESTSFPGDKVDTNAAGGILSLEFTSGSGYATEGTYYFDGSTALGDVYTSRIQGFITVSGEDASATMATWTSLAEIEALDNTDPSLWGVTFYYRATNDDPPTTDSVWTEWIPFGVTDVTAAYIEYKVILRGTTTISPAITRLGVICDMPDRHVVEKDLVSSSSAATTVTFAEPFKFLKGITFGIRDLVTGDYYTYTSSVTGFTINIYNSSNTRVVRHFDYDAAGYGRVVP